MNEGKYHSGLLNQRGDIQSRLLTAAGGGAFTEEWRNIAANLPMMVRPLTSRERLWASRLDAPISHRVVIRYRTDVTTDCRILYETSRSLNIRSVIDVDEKKRWLELLCEENVAP